MRDGSPFSDLATAAVVEYVCAKTMATNVQAHITGTVWKIEVKVGDAVEEGQTVVILESMKMEMPVEAPSAGTVVSIAIAEGQAVDEGFTLVVLE
jgi:acetyl-CoA carboxylase biotin carboxyl carrier protein